MTAHTSEGVWPSLTAENATQFDLASASRRSARWRDARVDDAVAVRRCAMYRKAIPGAALNFPVAVLRLEPVARWIRRHGVGVDVATADDVDRTVAAGIAPARTVMHCVDESAYPVRRAVEVGVGRFVIRSAAHVEVVAGNALHTRRVLIDVTDYPVHEVATEAMSCDRLDLIGLHCQLGGADPETTEDIVWEMVAQMAWVRREYGIILTRVSLREFEPADWCHDRNDLRDQTAALEEAVEDACARYRYPRPALVLSLRQSAIIPPE